MSHAILKLHRKFKFFSFITIFILISTNSYSFEMEQNLAELTEPGDQVSPSSQRDVEQQQQEVELQSTSNQQQQQQQQLATHRQHKQESTTAAPHRKRIYRIRAAGANGRFGQAPARVHLGQPEAEVEVDAAAGKQENFGERHRVSRLLKSLPSSSTSLSLSKELKATNGDSSKVQVSAVGRNCNQDQAASSIDGETAAEASSISASSQTLRLNSRPATSSNLASQTSLVLVQRNGQQRQPSHQVTGELDETPLLPLNHNIQWPTRKELKDRIKNNNNNGNGGEKEDENNNNNNNEETQANSPDSTGWLANQTGEQSRESSILSLIDEFDSQITTNKTQAQLSCDSGEMIIRLNFTEPFRGIVYPDHNRLSPCRFFGDGHHNYELRLPLRGCGTKQVAPRVFANDVIVRFHKTLELEEDEVKTLICRYPPPLDANSATAAAAAASGRERLAAGNGLVHELATGQHQQLNRSTSPHVLEQFELLDPVGAGTANAAGRPTNRLGQQENFGNEPLAPSSGSNRHYTGSQTLQELQLQMQQQRQRTKQQQQQQHADLILAPPLSGNKLATLRPSGNLHPLFESENSSSASANLLNDTTQPNSFLSSSSSSSSNLLDRLSSIELLFLISSLMFLVLLALGLAGSYYCFWRRERRHSNPLGVATTGGRHRRRKLRYFNAPHLAGGASRNFNSTLPTAYLPTTSSLYQSTTRPTNAANQQQQQQQLYFQQPVAQYQSQHQLLAAPSSPDDSDVSGQVLLPAPSSEHSVTTLGRRQQQNLILNHRAPSLGRAHFKQNQQDYEHEQQQQQLGQLPAHHYKASTISRQHLQPPHVFGRRNEQLYGGQQLVQATSQTLGRRRYDNSPASGGGGYLSSNLLRASERSDTNRPGVATATGGGGKLREPLLKLAYEEEDELKLLSPARNHHHHHYKQQQQQQQNRRHANHLHKARSMQQLHETPTGGAGEPLACWHQQHQQQLARYNSEIMSENSRPLASHKQQLGPSRRHEYQEQVASVNYARNRRSQTGTSGLGKAQLVSVESTSTSTSTSSDSELEMNNSNNNQNQNQTAGDEMPRLILRSIEDSFVTNFTEIQEQEYAKYDNRRPLSWAEWTSRQPNSKNSKAHEQKATPPPPPPEEDEQRERGELASSPTPSSLSESEPGTGKMDSRSQGVNSGLRSLTEVDVNFAKSLPRPTRQVKSTVIQQQQHKVGGEPEATAASTSLKLASTRATDTPTSPSPDLIISADYNFGRFKLVDKPASASSDGRDGGAGDKLKAGPKSPGAESHESISYV